MASVPPFHEFLADFVYFRARPYLKVTKLHNMADVTSARGSVPPSASHTTSTRTAPSTPASADVNITTAPTIPESLPETRVEAPLVVQSSSGTKTPAAIPQHSSTPHQAASVDQLNEPAKSSLDYSRLRVADNKSFSKAWIKIVELNDKSARLKDEEQLALRSLQMIHNVSFLTSSLCFLW